MKKILYSLVALSITFCMTGCDDFFNPDSDSVLMEDGYIGNRSELYSGFMGLAGCVQQVAEKAIYLEGLRGDLLEPTTNAPADMWAVYNYSDQLGSPFTNNSLADPKDYYNVIQNANDYLAHAVKFRKAYPTVLSEADYKGIIGGALRYKAWAYLMLAKVYGEAVYMDDPLAGETDLTKFPVLNFDQLIQKCVDLIETGIDVGDGVRFDGKTEIRWSTNLYPGQGDSPTSLSWNRICPSPHALLAELYLYQQKYSQVWQHCVEIIRAGGEEDSYTLNRARYDGMWAQFFSINTKQESFSSYQRMEYISVAYYDYDNGQANNVIDYFADADLCHYYLRPTQAVMDRFIKGEEKYRGNGYTFKQSDAGNWVMSKYLYSANSNPQMYYRSDIPIPLYRASDIHLWLAEACAGMGRFEEALVFLNGGIGPYFDGVKGQFVAPFTEYPTCLYQTPNKASLGSCAGVRGRVSAAAVGSGILDDEMNLTIPQERAKYKIDSLLVEESCFELSGEARSYYTMLRMAKRYGAEERKVWAKKVAAKYPDGGAAIESRLSGSIDNWFIKYDLKTSK